MRKIAVTEMTPWSNEPLALLHIPSGTVLLASGEPLTDEVIGEFRKAELEEVAVLAERDDIEEIRHDMINVSIPVDDLTPGSKLGRPVCDEEGRILLQANTPVPKSFAPSLKRRGIEKVFSRRGEEDLNKEKAEALRRAVLGHIREGAKEIEEKAWEFEQVELEEADEAELDADKLREKINSFTKIEVPPDGEPFAGAVRDTRKDGPISKAEKQVFSDIVGDSLTTVKTVFGEIESGSRAVDLQAIDKLASRIMGGMIRNRELLMLCSVSRDQEEYLVHHSLATMVLALNVGSTMGYETAQVKTLSYGALLADVGMLKISREIREKADKLNMRERAEVRLHPAHGLDTLQRIGRIPDGVPYIVYQSHERSNGSGYPCGKKDVVIHPFARIVAAADIYASVISERPYRSAKMPYEAMEDLLHMCGKRLINREVVKAFLACNSLVPVGSYAVLSDGSLARVVAANPQDYTRPVVSILVDKDRKRQPPGTRIDLCEQKDLSIRQAVDAEMAQVNGDVLLGF